MREEDVGWLADLLCCNRAFGERRSQPGPGKCKGRVTPCFLFCYADILQKKSNLGNKKQTMLQKKKGFLLNKQYTITVCF